MTDTWVCEECGTGWNSQAACEQCDCGTEDHHYSPSWRRINYTPGDD